MPYVIKQCWEESERGWGVRPDGYSLHIGEGNLKEYINDYWSRMPFEVQDEYSRPVGNPEKIEVPDDIYKLILLSKSGIRVWQHEVNKMGL